MNLINTIKEIVELTKQVKELQQKLNKYEINIKSMKENENKYIEQIKYKKVHCHQIKVNDTNFETKINDKNNKINELNDKINKINNNHKTELNHLNIKNKNISSEIKLLKSEKINFLETIINAFKNDDK